MAQAANPIGRREDLFNRVVSAIRAMPSDLQKIFLKTQYQAAVPARVAAELGLSEKQLAVRRVVAQRSFFANLEGRRLRVL